MTSNIKMDEVAPFKPTSIKWNRSMDNYSDSCTITVPAICKLTDDLESEYNNITTSKLMQEGLAVMVELGYDGKNKKQFQGFIKRINYKVPLEIECEGYSYLIRKVLDFNKSYPKKGDKTTTMKQILGDLLTVVNANTKYKIKLSNKIPDIVIDTPIQFEHKKGTDVLEWLKTNLLQTVYFDFDELYVGLQQTDHKGKEKVQLGWNTVKDDDLTFKPLKEFTQVNIEVSQRKQNGEIHKEEQPEENTSNGSTVQTKVIKLPLRVDPAAMKAIAASEQAKVKYRGYEGSVTTFLHPYTEPGMALEISDSKYTERNGAYLITGVEGEYGPNGGRVKVKLGNALSNQ